MPCTTVRHTQATASLPSADGDERSEDNYFDVQNGEVGFIRGKDYDGGYEEKKEGAEFTKEDDCDDDYHDVEKGEAECTRDVSLEGGAVKTCSTLLVESRDDCHRDRDASPGLQVRCSLDGSSSTDADDLLLPAAGLPLSAEKAVGLCDKMLKSSVYPRDHLHRRTPTDAAELPVGTDAIQQPAKAVAAARSPPPLTDAFSDRLLPPPTEKDSLLVWEGDVDSFCGHASELKEEDIDLPDRSVLQTRCPAGRRDDADGFSLPGQDDAAGLPLPAEEGAKTLDRTVNSLVSSRRHRVHHAATDAVVLPPANTGAGPTLSAKSAVATTTSATPGPLNADPSLQLTKNSPLRRENMKRILPAKDPEPQLSAFCKVSRKGFVPWPTVFLQKNYARGGVPRRGVVKVGPKVAVVVPSLGDGEDVMEDETRSTCSDDNQQGIVAGEVLKKSTDDSHEGQDCSYTCNYVPCCVWLRIKNAYI